MATNDPATQRLTQILAILPLDDFIWLTQLIHNQAQTGLAHEIMDGIEAGQFKARPEMRGRPRRNGPGSPISAMAIHALLVSRAKPWWTLFEVAEAVLEANPGLDKKYSSDASFKASISANLMRSAHFFERRETGRFYEYRARLARLPNEPRPIRANQDESGQSPRMVTNYEGKRWPKPEYPAGLARGYEWDEIGAEWYWPALRQSESRSADQRGRALGQPSQTTTSQTQPGANDP